METTSLFWKQLYGVCVSMYVLACVPYICMTGSDATKRAAYFSTSLVASSVNVVGCSHMSALLQAIAWMQSRRVGTGCVLGIRGVHTETGSELVGPNRFTKIGFDDLLAFTLLIRNRFKLHMFAHMLSTTETMDPFLVVCALLWAKMMLLHRFRVRPSCRHLFGISR